MKLKKKLPENRNFEQVRNHFEIEKSIAEKLKRANREERKKIFPVMYQELFTRVPDHPRFSKTKITDTNNQTLRFLKEYLKDSTVYVEFGPGDCQLASTVCKYAKKVTAVDIFDQRRDKSRFSSNFELIIYDGYDLNIERNSVDVVFSDQFIEHLHPEDVEYHFQLVNRILRDNGLYIFRTPHAYFGPHDISKFFSDEPEGFHLKEWTHSEIEKLLKKVNFASWDGFWRINNKLNNRYIKIPFGYFKIAEAMLKGIPKKPQRKVSRLFLPLKVFMIAVK